MCYSSTSIQPCCHPGARLKSEAALNFTVEPRGSAAIRREGRGIYPDQLVGISVISLYALHFRDILEVLCCDCQG